MGKVPALLASLSHQYQVAKRILALPGDEVVWSPPFSSDSTKEVTVVPDGHVWLEGDNSLNSTDSRQYVVKRSLPPLVMCSH